MRASRAETEILDFVLKNQPVTVGEAYAEFSSRKGLSRSTVQTLLSRLDKKGFLVRCDREGVLAYQSATAPNQVRSQLIGDFVDISLGGSVSPFLAYLTEKVELTEEERETLQAMIDRLKGQEDEK